MKLLVVGLGNIGREYVHTRHNVGFLSVEHIAQQHKVSFQTHRLALVAAFAHQKKQVYLIKPTTYMNESGKSVRYWLQALRIPLEQSIAIVDDIALPFGALRLRFQGSDGGHNGLKSIASCLASNQYPRLRVGIGSDFPKGQLADFVLSDFTCEERSALPLQLEKTHEMVLTWCQVGIVRAMNQYNKA